MSFGKRKRGPIAGCGSVPLVTRAATDSIDTDDIRHQIVVDYIFAQMRGDERPYLKVSILGRKLCGLLDSGASRTILGKKGWDIVRELGCFWIDHASAPVCTVANGQKCVSYGTVALPIELLDRVETVNVLIVPDMPHTLILGLDFWKSMGIVPDLRRNEWSFSESEPVQASAIHSYEDLTGAETERLNNVVTRNYARMGDGIGRTHLVEHVIKTDSPPIKKPHYRMSPYVLKEVDQELKRLVDSDIIERSNSPWSSNIVLVPKKDGTKRVCVDFRAVNKVSKKDSYPVPFVSDILDKLRDAKYLTSLDIKSAYWQVPLSEESKEITAFTVPNRGLWQFKVMPMGLHNSGATWQRLLDRVLSVDLEPYVFCYLDDVIIVTESFEKHLEILDIVFDKLIKAGLTLNKEKCQFCRRELKYLGYVVNGNGLSVDPDKIKAILSIPTPKNQREVRSVLGMASWYRRFVPDYATILAPVTALLKRGTKFDWDEKCEEAWGKLKGFLTSAPVLSCPNFDLPFVVQTDASDFGLGAVLSQTDVNGGEHVVAYLSRSLTKAERKYSVTEKECLAVIFAIEKLRPYIEGTRFTVVTDHYSLLWLHNLKDPMGRLARWAVRLQGFDFEVVHRKGKEHLVPDCLSRSVPRVDVIEFEFPIVPKDRWYVTKCRKVESNPLLFPDWRITEGRLYKRVRTSGRISSGDADWKIVVPKDSRAEVFKRFHDHPVSGHAGVFKTFHRIIADYYWPKMRSDIQAYVRRCRVCLEQKPLQKASAGLMGRHPVVDRPWQLTSADLIGPLPRSSQGFRYMLVIHDCFTKYPVVIALRSATASLVTKHVEESVFLTYGVPQYLICDNGGQFKSGMFRDLLKKYGVTPLYTAYYHPQANPTERVNRIVKTMLSSYVKENHKSWGAYVPQITCAIRTARQEVTGYTPFFLNFGREIVLFGGNHGNDKPILSFGDREKFGLGLSKLEEIRKFVRKRLDVAYGRSKARYDLRKRNETFSVGQSVWKRNMVLSDASKDFAAKLAPKFNGPFTVQAVTGYCTYRLVDEQGNDRGVWHAKDLKAHPPE